MLIRASAKFRRHYGCAVEKCNPLVQPFPQTWNLDILSHGPSQRLVFASEEYSLFSVIIPTSRSRKLELFMPEFRARLLQLFENVLIRSVDLPDLHQVTLTGRSDRRIIGSQNDLLFATKYFLAESEKPASSATIREIEERINETPLSYLEMDSPIEVLRRKTALPKAR